MSAGQDRDLIVISTTTVALLERHIATGDDITQQDLDVDLVIAAINAGGIVDGIGIDASAGQRIFDAPGLGCAEITALATTLAPS